MTVSVPFSQDPNPPVGSRALSVRAARRGEEFAAAGHYPKVDVEATAALVSNTVRDAVRTLTGRNNDVLLGASVRSNLKGDRFVISAVARRVSDGRTFRAFLTDFALGSP